jgi:hypothetical protein
MDRRAFLTGLLGVAGAVTATGLGLRTGHAAPLGPTLRAPAAELEPSSAAGRTPDGTPVQEAQYYYGDPWRRRRRRWRRRWRRRRARYVCRTRRIRGRWVRRCRWVYPRRW